ncbi:unnamed protein product [Ectocarpus sp. 12 AP-2014]
MPYIRNGQVVAQRSVFRPSIIMEIFWKVLNIVGLFFGTMSAKTPARKPRKERGYHNYLGGGGGGGGGDDDSGGGGGGRRRRGPNIHTVQPPDSCSVGGGGG